MRKLLLGAGTVVTPDQAKMCMDVGVDFGLAPGLNPDTMEAGSSFYGRRVFAGASDLDHKTVLTVR